jgi:hypothetical protein
MLTIREWLLAVIKAAVTWVALAACTNLEAPTSSTPPQLVVHAVLDTHAAFQTILVYRARTGVQAVTSSALGDDEPVSGALVTVTAPNGTVMAATESPAPSPFLEMPGSYFFTPSQFGAALEDGGTYTLHVRTRAGEDASGTTTIPASSLLGSIGYVMRSRDTLRLNWPRVPGAQSYELILRSFVNYRVFTDTSVAIPGTTLTIQGDLVLPPGDRIDLIVSAVDANYYDYYRAQSDPFAGAAPSHLTGAVGVFGSIAPIYFGQVQVR